MCTLTEIIIEMYMYISHCISQSIGANLVVFEEAVKELGGILELGLPHLPVVINLYSRLIPCHLDTHSTHTHTVAIQFCGLFLQSILATSIFTNTVF